ncbi:MAG: hypothetical protein KDD38_05985 [Bdellovibrionales bacterium]|nr:hypothetical protein [Bdellovibrionales bacterium]
MLSGCATFDGKNQGLLVTSNPPGAGIYYKGELVGNTPAPVIVKRSKSEQLDIVYKNSKKTIVVPGEFRWGKVTLGNLIFLTLYPIGVVTDFVTGAAYQMNDQVHYDFPEFSGKTKTSKTTPMVIAIAPPNSTHANLSDEAGVLIEHDLIQNSQINSKLIPYYLSLPIFESEDVDYNTKAEKEHIYYLYARLQATHLLQSEVSFKNDKAVVTGEFIPFDENDRSIPYNKEFETDNINYTKNTLWAGKDGQIFYFLPNSISIDFSNSRTSLDVDQATHDAKPEPLDGFWGDFLKFLSTVGVRRILPPIDRPGWRGRIVFTPTANVSYSKERFPTFLPVADQIFLRTHVDAGYGPSFIYENRSHAIYLNIIPALEWDEVQTLGTEKYRVNQTTIAAVVELGYRYHYNRHWSLTFFSRSVPTAEELWKKIFTKTTSQYIHVENSNLIFSGVSINYTFPNKILK